MKQNDLKKKIEKSATDEKLRNHKNVFLKISLTLIYLLLFLRSDNNTKMN